MTLFLCLYSILPSYIQHHHLPNKSCNLSLNFSCDGISRLYHYLTLKMSQKQIFCDDFLEKLLISFPEIQQYTHLFTTNNDDANDLLQETLLKALCYHGYYKNDKNFNGWLYTIMYNTFLNKSRADKYTSSMEFGHCDHLRTRIYIDYEHSYCELLSLVESLPESYCVPFEMHAAGYKYHEIAQRLGISIGTVKSRIHSARQRLKMMLQ